jgi:hypothetical protein
MPESQERGVQNVTVSNKASRKSILKQLEDCEWVLNMMYANEAGIDCDRDHRQKALAHVMKKMKRIKREIGTA